MDQSSENTRRKKKRSFIEQLVHNLKKTFSGTGKSDRKEYRPYLGPRHKSQSSSSGEDAPQPESVTYSSGTRKKKQKSASGLSGIKEWKRKLELRREERKKQKFKRKIKKSHQREHKKRERIDFIRKFYPNYKREKNVPFEELSAEQAAEAIKLQQKNYFYYTINSTALFIIAYLAVYMLYQFAVMITASNWKLDSVLLYYDLAFNDYSPLWSRTNIIIVTLSGPLVCLVTGFLFYRFFSTRKKVKGFVKLFFLWIAMIGLNFFFGAWANGISFDQGFGYVPAWLYLNVFWQILIALIFLFLLGIIGYYSVPKFLDTSKSAYRVRPENKNKFLFYQVLLPYLIGSLIIILVRIPNILPYDTGNLITLIFGLVPMVFNRYARPTVAIEKEKKRPTDIRWWYIVIFVVLILAYRIGLNNGLHINLIYEFTFTIDITPL